MFRKVFASLVLLTAGLLGGLLLSSRLHITNDSLASLRLKLADDLPPDFPQSMVPKLVVYLLFWKQLPTPPSFARS